MIPRRLEPEIMDDTLEARAYAEADFSRENHAFLSRLRELGAQGHMLDLGTGPGDIPRLLLESDPDATIDAIDLSPAMLALAEHRLAHHPDAARLQLQRGDVTALDAENARYDVVFSNTTLHHLPDPRPMLREACRVLRPGGLLVIRDLYRPDSLDQVEHLVTTHTACQTATTQQLFRQSLIAAHTPDELIDLLHELEMHPAIQLSIDTDRHATCQGRKPE